MYGKLSKNTGGEICISEVEIVEINIGSVGNFDSSQVPCEHFTGRCGLGPCKSDFLWEIKL